MSRLLDTDLWYRTCRARNNVRATYRFSPFDSTLLAEDDGSPWANWRPGTRVVTISVDLEGWEPSAFDSDDLIYLPYAPTPGGLETYPARRESSSSQDKFSIK